MRALLKHIAAALFCLALMLLSSCGRQSTEPPPSQPSPPSPSDSIPPLTLVQSKLGYIIAYNPELYQLHTYEDSDSFWCDVGLYLSVSFLPDVDAEYVVAGLRLQEDIESRPEPLPVGTGHYAAQSLQYTDALGNSRRFWVLEHRGGILLMEQSVPAGHPDTPLHHSAQQAMLDSLTLTP